VQALASYLSSLDASTCADVAATLEDGMEVDVELATDDGGVETLRLGPEHVQIRREPAEGTAFAYEAPFGVSLDLEITPELKRAGFVREFVHLVQGLRREAGLEVTDRIALVVAGPDEALAALREHTDEIAEELLATSVDIGGEPGGDAKTVSVDGTGVTVALRKDDADG
jgi:isoleucyl-tRNA synthetase